MALLRREDRRLRETGFGRVRLAGVGGEPKAAVASSLGVLGCSHTLTCIDQNFDVNESAPATAPVNTA